MEPNRPQRFNFRNPPMWFKSGFLFLVVAIIVSVLTFNSDQSYHSGFSAPNIFEYFFFIFLLISFLIAQTFGLSGQIPELTIFIILMTLIGVLVGLMLNRKKEEVATAPAPRALYTTVLNIIVSGIFAALVALIFIIQGGNNGFSKCGCGTAEYLHSAHFIKDIPEILLLSGGTFVVMFLILFMWGKRKI